MRWRFSAGRQGKEFIAHVVLRPNNKEET
jgi:hypothetical protein